MKKSILILMLFVMLLTLLSAFYDVSAANAQKMYGYKAGDVYFFIMEACSTADTEKGKTTTRTSLEVKIIVEDVTENTEGYHIKIDTLIVISGFGIFPGQYYGGYNRLIQKQTFEGDKPITEGGGGAFGFSPVSLFTTTEWDKRGDEWNEFVEQIDGYKGTTVTNSYASDGIFTVTGELDVSPSDSYIDYDGDGSHDGYTGTFSIRHEYDGNGVLSSSSMEVTMRFNYKNSLTSTYKIYRGPKTFMPAETTMYLAIGGLSVACVATFFIGFYIGKSRKPKAPASIAKEEKENLKRLLDSLDRQLVEGKISEETYQTLKKKYESMLKKESDVHKVEEEKS